MTKRTCEVVGCDKPHRARGLCNTHYGQQNPNKYRTVTVECSWCGAECVKESGRSNRYANLYCSVECRSAHRVSLTPPRPAKVQADRRAPLRRAYEDGDSAALIAAVRVRCAVTDGECWEWPRLDRAGYPAQQIGRKYVAVHRAVLEAATGETLGARQAHHRCANPACVNPGHLQAVSAVDNRAEMFQRKWYEARIAELESALAEVAPGHQALGSMAA